MRSLFYRLKKIPITRKSRAQAAINQPKVSIGQVHFMIGSLIATKL